ncbi:hypothetical protein [Kordia sp.]|uniref:hypothetical protein n=1 Tax=Kordia sp. TaxID=1965332 RepID=UPI003D2701C3
MKKNYLILLLFLVSTTGLFAQINFEKGYFISNNGQKTDCYIKNVDWINNPVSFDYKITLDGEVKIARLATVKSFTIPNICKYEKHTINVDMSTKDYAKLNNDKNPEWQEKTSFLNILVEGDATLYHYKNAETSQFFFKKGTNNLETLVYKYYLVGEDQLAKNTQYRQQLYTSLTCEAISRKRVSNLSYNRNDLTRFFVDYNSCVNDDFVAYKQESKGAFHLRAEVGIVNQKTSLDSRIFQGLTASSNEIGPKWGSRFGFDLEFALPFNKNKWAAFFAPYYQSFEGEGEVSSESSPLFIPRTYEIKYAAIQMPIGIRHYMYVNDISRLFLNAGVVMDIPLTTEISGELGLVEENFKTSVGGVFGIGYNYKDYYVEARIITSRELLEKTSGSSLSLSHFSFSLGYQFL